MTLPDRCPGESVAPGRRRPGDIPVAAMIAWASRRRVGLAVAAGVVLRLAGYLSRRYSWMDEGALIEVIKGATPLGFFGPLGYSQLAPPGFLVVAWASLRLLGDSLYAMRLVPLAGGVAALFLFLAVARRCLPGRAVFPAVLMLAVAGDPIYYSAEVKQYSTDLALALACWLAGLTIGSRPLTSASSAGLAIGGAAVVWFSHPSIFVLASVGVVGLARAVGAKDARSAGLWGLVGVAWVASFAGVHAVAARQLGGSDQMWRFWDFAFPPTPPRSIWDATWAPRRLAYYLINPLNFDAPFGERASLLPALGLALLGAVRLWKLDRGRWALLVLPIALTLLAASLKLYPFHGRLVLFLAPVPLLAIADGLDAVREARGRGVLYWGLATMVLVVPAAQALGQVIEPKPLHNHLGDLHPANIDPYLFPF